MNATASTVPRNSRSFYVQDKETGAQFLVDKGAEISVVPPVNNERRSIITALTLKATNISDRKTYGKRKLTLNFGRSISFCWEFAIADASVLIIGIDFLKNFD